jgi:ribonuclease D
LKVLFVKSSGLEHALGGEERSLPEQLVTEPQELSTCCVYLASCSVFGLDTEFVGEDTYHPHLCLVQVATPERLILIDPLSAGPLGNFWKLVTDPSHQVVVHAGREEIRLCRHWSGSPPGNLFDLQVAAGLAGLAYPLGHATLVSQLLRVQLTKAETLTEWRDRPLSRAQIRYAFDDVRYLLPLWQRLSRRLENLKRTDWAAEEFARMCQSALPEEGPVEKWRKLRGLGSLDRRRLAVVRALYTWREETAARTNRPTRSICRDDLLVEIARRNPARERDLHNVRGLPRRDLRAIVEVVEKAGATPLEQCPTQADREQDPPQVQLVAGVMNAVLGDLCVRQRLAPTLVATSQDIKLLVRSKYHKIPLSSESLLAQGWRAAHILPELLAVLEGRRSLRIANLRAENPLDITDIEGGTP